MERIVEYTGREPLKQIHWKLSARGDDFKVKEYGEPAGEPLLIEPDKLTGSLEERISKAAWLVRTFGEKRAVGLSLGDELVLPQHGKRQVRRLLGVLAVYGTGRTEPLKEDQGL